jgi:hypothetical protein
MNPLFRSRIWRFRSKRVKFVDLVEHAGTGPLSAGGIFSLHLHLKHYVLPLGTLMNTLEN